MLLFKINACAKVHPAPVNNFAKILLMGNGIDKIYIKLAIVFYMRTFAAYSFQVEARFCGILFPVRNSFDSSVSTLDVAVSLSETRLGQNRIALATASVPQFTCSLVYMFFMCVRVVSMLMWHSAFLFQRIQQYFHFAAS